MLSALSSMLGRSSVPAPSPQALTTLNEVATEDMVLDGLRKNTVVDARFHEYNRALWQGLGRQYFPQVTTPQQMADPISFFNTQQNTLNLSLLTAKPGDEVLARKQLAVGLLLKSFAIRKPDLPLAEILKGIVTGPAASLEKEALQTAVAVTLEFDPDKARANTDFSVVLTTYLGREQQVHEMFGQMMGQMGEKLKAWGLEMAALNSYFSLAQLLITCEAQLVRDAAGKITAEVAFRGNLRMVELLYPHIRACACDEDPKYCVLEKAALAKQREVVAYLLSTHAEDFPTEARVKLLQSMARQGKGEVVTFLLTDFRQDFSATQILSLRGTPGFENSETSYWQLLGAPAVQRVGGLLGGLWRTNNAAIPVDAGALIPAPPAAANASASVLAIEHKESDGSDQNDRRKKLAIEAAPMLLSPPTFTPAATAAAATAAPATVVAPSSTEQAGALVPFLNKKRPHGS